MAKATDQSESDIDLMIISDGLTYGKVFGALEQLTFLEAMTEAAPGPTHRRPDGSLTHQ